SYLDFRVKVQGKGLGYMLRNFGIPFIKSRITTTMLARFLQDHARDNGDVDEKQRIDYDLTDVEEMLINPVTGIQDPAYFTQYAKVFIASYFIAAARQPVALAKEKSDATRMEEELKVTISEVLDVEGNDDEEIVEEPAGEEEVVDSEPAETEESGEIEETNGNEE
ncbi:MAG: hypothetical protein GYA24_00875, partial [Candidatus Lokiarchaeota archaeon]|nr:hypothetical protein [Candidatus Lokiarchaeota archaeon]